MGELTAVEVRAHIDAVFRAESGRILATLVRLLGSLDLAEDAMHDAFSTALQRCRSKVYPRIPVPG